MFPEGRQMPSVFGLLRFFNYLQFQKIKRDSFDKAILGKPGFGNSLEFRNIGIQPDGLTQIKFVTDVVQSLKDHGSTGNQGNSGSQGSTGSNDNTGGSGNSGAEEGDHDNTVSGNTISGNTLDEDSDA